VIPDFAASSLWLIALVFGGSAATVWVAGSKLAGYANVLADRTGIGKAFTGLVLLGGVTSLPEAAVSVTAAIDGDAALAINNLLGGVTMQVTILAAADLLVLRAITTVVVQPAVILQGAFGVLMLTVVAVAIGIGDIGVAGVGLASLALVVLTATGVWMAKADENLPGWTPVNRPSPDTPAPPRSSESTRQMRLTGLVGRIAVAGVVVLLAGVLLARTAEAIAEQTGLGSSFVGAVLVAISTSLPEISTVLAAIRLGQYGMAFSDIFGTNLFDIALIFVVDAFYTGQPVLLEVGNFSLFAALLGAAATLVYIIGLIERRDGALPRIGYDSVAVTTLYLCGLVVMYRLR
jgi:cation:H+ antiporter